MSVYSCSIVILFKFHFPTLSYWILLVLFDDIMLISAVFLADVVERLLIPLPCKFLLMPALKVEMWAGGCGSSNTFISSFNVPQNQVHSVCPILPPWALPMEVRYSRGSITKLLRISSQFILQKLDLDQNSDSLTPFWSLKQTKLVASIQPQVEGGTCIQIFRLNEHLYVEMWAELSGLNVREICLRNHSGAHPGPAFMDNFPTPSRMWAAHLLIFLSICPF